MKKTIKYHVETKAVWWDGTQQAWEEVCGLEWDDCYISKEQPGVMWLHLYKHEIPVDSWVAVDDRGTIIWLKEEEVEVLDEHQEGA